MWVCVGIPVASSAPPPEVALWGREPVEVASPVRTGICLNGVWRFQPAVADAVAAPTDAWGYVRVPGTFSLWSWTMPYVVRQGRGPVWDAYRANEKATVKGWYERRFRVPESWRGRAVLLELRRVSTDASIEVNGRPCGTVNWPYGTVDISRAVRYGEDNDLRALVVTAAHKEEVMVLMGPDQVSTRKARIWTRGLIGDVLLRSRPAGAHVSDVFVKPSVRKGRVDVEIELTGVRAAGTVSLRAQFLAEDGEVEKDETATVDVIAADRQTVETGWTWEAPRLWDLGQPDLYHLLLTVDGPGIRDVCRQRFGFRELWIEGRQFYLNGTVFHLRPIQGESYLMGGEQIIDSMIDGYRAAGFNIQEFWPWDHDERTKPHFREQWAEHADRKGWPLMGALLTMGHLADKWHREGVKEAWEQRMLADMKRYRNHPSIVMWAAHANRFGHRDDQNPRRIGINTPPQHPLDKDVREHFAVGEHAVAIGKRHDPPKRRWISNDRFDYGDGWYDYGWFGSKTKVEGKHTRQVIFVKGTDAAKDGYYVVIDTIEPKDDLEHTWRHPWHLQPDDIRILPDDSSIVTTSPNGAMRIFPADPDGNLSVQMMRGQKQPVYLGWRVYGQHFKEWNTPTYAWTTKGPSTKAWGICLGPSGKGFPVRSVSAKRGPTSGDITLTVARADGGTDLILRRRQAGGAAALGPASVNGDIGVVCLNAGGAPEAVLDVPSEQ